MFYDIVNRLKLFPEKLFAISKDDSWSMWKSGFLVSFTLQNPFLIHHNSDYSFEICLNALIINSCIVISIIIVIIINIIIIMIH